MKAWEEKRKAIAQALLLHSQRRHPPPYLTCLRSDVRGGRKHRFPQGVESTERIPRVHVRHNASCVRGKVKTPRTMKAMVLVVLMTRGTRLGAVGVVPREGRRKRLVMVMTRGARVGEGEERGASTAVGAARSDEGGMHSPLSVKGTWLMLVDAYRLRMLADKSVFNAVLCAVQTGLLWGCACARDQRKLRKMNAHFKEIDDFELVYEG